MAGAAKQKYSTVGPKSYGTQKVGNRSALRGAYAAGLGLGRAWRGQAAPTHISKGGAGFSISSKSGAARQALKQGQRKLAAAAYNAGFARGHSSQPRHPKGSSRGGQFKAKGG